jgi:DNA-binding SARP family transcriptional activator
MRFGILGPLEVAHDGGRQVVLGGRKQRSVLAILLVHANEVVSADRLKELWSGRPPPSAATSLQAHVSRLRRALGDDQRIVTTAGGIWFGSRRVSSTAIALRRWSRRVGR